MVTHQIGLLNPNSRTSQRRSASERTPNRAISHHHRPTTAAASAESTTCPHWAAVSGPISATSGSRVIAGNGANGT